MAGALRRIPVARLIAFKQPIACLASPPQDEINRRYARSSALQMMCWMNFWCGIYYLPVLFGFTTMGRDLLAFCQRHPEVRLLPAPGSAP